MMFAKLGRPLGRRTRFTKAGRAGTSPSPSARLPSAHDLFSRCDLNGDGRLYGDELVLMERELQALQPAEVLIPLYDALHTPTDICRLDVKQLLAGVQKHATGAQHSLVGPGADPFNRYVITLLDIQVRSDLLYTP